MCINIIIHNYYVRGRPRGYASTYFLHAKKGTEYIIMTLAIVRDYY